ncbi:MAG: AI-2E family transporter [Limisphaerales bacterium]|jgi:predicted PurR-regulated permease PerM|nr:AI-2E family transporter [Verrucomicrobiota bacterium]
MEFPKPTKQQARWLWHSLTALAIGVLVAMAVFLVWGGAWLASKLSAVLIPLAAGGIIACLLDPLVVFLERRKIPRRWGVLLVLLVLGAILALVLAWIIPFLVVEINDFIKSLPSYLDKLQVYWETQIHQLNESLAASGWGDRAKIAWDQGISDSLQKWGNSAFAFVGSWILGHLSRILSLGSFVIGILLVPIYTYYFLVEREAITLRWKNYVPLWESKAKEEAVWFLNTVSESMVVFFRGQVLVALCEGTLLTIGFLLIGMKYAILIGAVAGIFSIIPYLGIALSIIPAVLLALAQFGTWTEPLLVVIVYVAVHLFDGYIVFPKVIGDRVGMHPAIIIVAVLVGATLMGGILGAILAIPVTAVLRALMFRYVWMRGQDISLLTGNGSGASPPASAEPGTEGK